MKCSRILALCFLLLSCTNGDKVTIKDHTRPYGFEFYPDYFVSINNEYLAIPKNKLDEFVDNFHYGDSEKVNLYENRDKFIRVVKWNSENMRSELFNKLKNKNNLSEEDVNILDNYIFLTTLGRCKSRLAPNISKIPYCANFYPFL